MAIKKRTMKLPSGASPTLEELQRETANAVADEKRRRETAARQANAEKQKRFRENMKAWGFRQVLLWDFPCPVDVRERMTAAGFRQCPAWETAPGPGGKEKPLPAGVVKAAVAIHESSLGAGDKLPEVRDALSRATGEFLYTLSGGSPAGTLSPEAKAVYNDFQELIRHLGDSLG